MGGTQEVLFLKKNEKNKSIQINGTPFFVVFENIKSFDIKNHDKNKAWFTVIKGNKRWNFRHLLSQQWLTHVGLVRGTQNDIPYKGYTSKFNA